MQRTVLVLGGGVGGMTAAHELALRGFHVDVLDQRLLVGGKARSLGVPDSGSGGRPGLPGEHGFRFFPGFYKHLPDTMARIPYGGGTCFDRLVGTSLIALARDGAEPIEVPARAIQSLADIEAWVQALVGIDGIGLQPGEAERFSLRMWQVMTSCKDRRLQELEAQSWWDFIGAEGASVAFQKYLAAGLSRSLVAARAEVASARTVGQVQVHLLEYLLQFGGETDRVLDGPTTEVWLNPWLGLLRQLGVQFHHQAEVLGFDVQDGQVAGVRLRNRGKVETRTADYYVSALPVEVMARLVSPQLLAIAPELAPLHELSGNVAWMNGLQLYLRTDVPVTPGHVLYVDSPWAITSISQAQFWHGVDLRRRGDGQVTGILSVDISDWDQPGITTPKPARACSKQEIVDEVWHQLTLALNIGSNQRLHRDNLHSAHLDDDIEIPDAKRPHPTINQEPLFINKPSTWSLRPRAGLSVPNLVLASDYVQTESDLACMEAANEAARRAVNAILLREGSAAEPCALFDMDMPLVLRPLRQADQARFDAGKPWQPLP